jgi:hypothetical protein
VNEQGHVNAGHVNIQCTRPCLLPFRVITHWTTDLPSLALPPPPYIGCHICPARQAKCTCFAKEQSIPEKRG